MDQVEISLHDAVLARRAVDGDVGIVKHDSLAVLSDERKVVAIYLGYITIIEGHVPVLPSHIDNIDVVALLVKKGIESLCRANGDIMFWGVAATNDGNVSL